MCFVVRPFSSRQLATYSVNRPIHPPTFTPYINACFRSRFRGILIEIRNEGYIPYRGYVPLPAAEGDVADLGVIRLEVKQERSQ